MAPHPHLPGTRSRARRLPARSGPASTPSRGRPLAVALVVAVALTALMIVGHGAYTRGWVRFCYPSATELPVRGIDVSHHQGAIDFAAVRAAGVRFVILKASEGGQWQDPTFGRHAAAAAAAGLDLGAYHFFSFRIDRARGATQARNYLAAVGADLRRLALPPLVDVEFEGNAALVAGREPTRAELAEFLRQVEAATGRRPVIYATEDSEGGLLGDRFATYARWRRSLWHQPGAPGGPVILWQFADNATLPGVATAVDMNAFLGSGADYAHWLAASQPGRSRFATPEDQARPAK